MDQQKYTVEQFGQQVKAKYPQYSQYSDTEVGRKMLEKYPQYHDKIITQTEEPQSGFLKSLNQGITNIGKDIVGVERNKSQSIIPTIARNTIGSSGLAGVAQLPGRVIADYKASGDIEKLAEQATKFSEQSYEYTKQARTETDPKKKLHLQNAAKQFNQSAVDLNAEIKNLQEQNTTPGQAVGTTVNAALTAVTGVKPNVLGELNPAFQTLAKGTSFVSPAAKALYYGGRVAENAVLGGSFQAGMNLADKKPIDEGVVTSSIVGAALPIAGLAASKGKEALQVAAGNTSERVINSLIKPSIKNFGYGKNPAQGIIREGIVANTMEDLGTQVHEVG